MPDLLIKVSRDLAQKLKHADSCSGSELGQALARYGARLSPPQAGEGEAAQYFQVQQVAGDRMDSLRQDLAGLPGIEAAYIKPDAELP